MQTPSSFLVGRDKSFSVICDNFREDVTNIDELTQPNIQWPTLKTVVKFPNYAPHVLRESVLLQVLESKSAIAKVDQHFSTNRPISYLVHLKFKNNYRDVARMAMKFAFVDRKNRPLSFSIDETNVIHYPMPMQFLTRDNCYVLEIVKSSLDVDVFHVLCNTTTNTKLSNPGWLA